MVTDVQTHDDAQTDAPAKTTEIQHDPIGPVAWVFVIIVMGFLGLAVWSAAAGIYAANAKSGSENHYALSDYFREAGFDPTVEHPVHIGSSVNGTSGSVNGSVNLFFGTGSGSVNGNFGLSSSIKMLLPLEDGSSILVMVPANQIVYHTEGVRTASISFAFIDVEDFGQTDAVWSYRKGDDWMLFDRPVKNPAQPGPRESSRWDDFASQPLESWLLQSVGRIDLHITQSQLDSILSN